MIYVLAVAGICVLFGVILIIKELRAPKENEEAVAIPVTKIEEIKDFKKDILKKNKQDKKGKLLSLPQDIVGGEINDAPIFAENLKVQEVENIKNVEEVDESESLVGQEEKNAFVKQMEDIRTPKENALEEKEVDFNKQLDDQRQKITQLEKDIEGFQKKYQGLEESVEAQILEKTQTFVDKIVVLQKENSELIQELKSIRVLNAQMAEKESSIALELAKYRAQSLGLERICEDLKKQNEELAKGLKG